MNRICVFCASNQGVVPAFTEATLALGGLLGQQGLGLVYGGGAVGLMGLLADSALRAGAEVLGVIPQSLAVQEIAHKGLTRLEIVSSLHTRKARMADLADAFIALPGGFGTLDELFDILTWGQLGLHRKPIGLLNVAGYYDPLLRFIEGSVSAGLVRPEHAAMLHVAEAPAQLIAALRTAEPHKEVPKWIKKDSAAVAR